MQSKFSDGSVIVTGTLTRDAELKRVGDKNRPVTTINAAVGKRKDTTTIFATIKAWGRLAEYASRAEKGDAVCAVGRIESREYNGKTYDDLVCDWLNIAGGAPSTASAIPPVSMQEFEELADDDPDGLPF